MSPTKFFIGDLSVKTPSGCVLGGWAWLTSITLLVIGRPLKNVGQQFGEMSATNFCRPFFVLATNVADVFMGRRRLSATFLDKCKQAVSRSQVPYTTENMCIYVSEMHAISINRTLRNLLLNPYWTIRCHSDGQADGENNYWNTFTAQYTSVAR